MSLEDVRREADELNAEIAELLERKDRLNESVEEIRRLSETLEASLAQLRLVGGIENA